MLLPWYSYFDAVCDLDIMNDIAYATGIVTVQKCRVNSITLLSLTHAWESDRSRIVVLNRFVMNYVRDREGSNRSNLIKSRPSMLVRIAVGKVSLAPGPFFYHRDTPELCIQTNALRTPRSAAYCLFKSLAVHGIRAFLTSPSPLAFAATVAACAFSRTPTGKKTEGRDPTSGER